MVLSSQFTVPNFSTETLIAGIAVCAIAAPGKPASTASRISRQNPSAKERSFDIIPSSQLWPNKSSRGEQLVAHQPFDAARPGLVSIATNLGGRHLQVASGGDVALKDAEGENERAHLLHRTGDDALGAKRA